MEITRDNHDFALELGPGEVCICDLEFCHIALLEILCKVRFKFRGRSSLRGIAPPHIVKTPLMACGAGGSLEQRHATSRLRPRYLRTCYLKRGEMLILDMHAGTRHGELSSVPNQTTWSA